MLHVADNANNFYPLDLRVTRPADALAEWILVLEILLHECVVRDADAWRVIVEVLWSKITSLPQGDLHDLEVVAEDAASFEARFVTGIYRRPVLDHEIVIERVAAEWQLADHRGLHAG